VIKVFLSGPYTGDGDPTTAIENTHRMMGEAVRLIDDGYAVFNPLMAHFYTGRHGAHITYEQWMAQDLAFVPCCDVLLRLGGESAGADREVKVARDHNIPVVYSADEIGAAMVAKERGKRYLSIKRVEKWSDFAKERE